MRELVVYGLGELGQLYGAAALRAGLRVTPITRAVVPASILSALPLDTPVLVAVGEASLDAVLSALGARLESAILLQNELFPSQWESHGATPTVLVPWVLKKRCLPLAVARATPVFGRHAALISTLHAALELPSVELGDEPSLHQALVDKYAFILSINALGLLRDRTLGTWLQEHPGLVDALALESAELGAQLCQRSVNTGSAAASVREGMLALASTGARGRTAESRVRRALQHAARLGLRLPELTRAAEQATL